MHKKVHFENKLVKIGNHKIHMFSLAVLRSMSFGIESQDFLKIYSHAGKQQSFS